MKIQMISLNQLVPSTLNVRKTGAKTEIKALAASIKAHGLLQNLQVKASSDNEFEVVAGGRRLAALLLLVKQKEVKPTDKFPCHVLDEEDAQEISLAENVMRLPMHPADQYKAFRNLTDAGKGPEEIAARFGVSASTVKQRLKLTSVSPRLFALYRKDEMTLDHLMAFTITDDHEAQEAAWFDQQDYQRSPSRIRQALTSTHVEADDMRVAFVGIETYKKAGGNILRDLFQPEHEGYLTDPALLEKLAIDKLERKAKKLRAEGWKWVGTATEISFETLRAFGRAQPKRKPLSDEQQEELDKLAAEQDALAAEGDEFDDETLEKLDGMSQRIDELSEGEPEWTDAIRANAGVVVTIGYNGEFRIERGLVKPEDKKAFVSVSKGQNEPSADESEPTDNTAAGYSSALVEDLTAQRTAALRALLKNNEAVALAAVAHAMALPLFYDIVPSAESCLALRIQNRDLRRSADGIVQSRAYDAVETAWTIWKEKLPLDETALFDWLLTQEQTIVTGLISFCAAMSIDAVRGKSDRSDNPRLTHADQLAKALSLDMAEWWTATKDTFLRRVPKKLVLAAVTEGVSAQAAENLASLKKEALVESAEQRLAGTGWLPPMLRKAA